jgi:hypothetical protein
MITAKSEELGQGRTDRVSLLRPMGPMIDTYYPTVSPDSVNRAMQNRVKVFQISAIGFRVRGSGFSEEKPEPL